MTYGSLSHRLPHTSNVGPRLRQPSCSIFQPHRSISLKPPTTNSSQRPLSTSAGHPSAYSHPYLSLSCLSRSNLLTFPPHSARALPLPPAAVLCASSDTGEGLSHAALLGSAWLSLPSLLSLLTCIAAIIALAQPLIALTLRVGPALLSLDLVSIRSISDHLPQFPLVPSHPIPSHPISPRSLFTPL
jgi:hypothetical protein